MKKISIVQAVLDAIDETDSSITKHMNQLLKWARYCEKQIGSLNGYPIAMALETVEFSHIKLPDNCYRVLALIPGDYSDQYNLLYKDMGKVVVTVETIPTDDYDLEYVWQNLSSSSIPSALWEEIGDELALPEDYDNQVMTLVYQYIELDEKGYWLVNESHIEAIKRYIVYMLAKKHLYKKFTGAKLTHTMDISMVKEYKADYSHAIRNARAEDQKETPLDNPVAWR